MNLERFQKLKEQVEQAKQDLDQALGARGELLKRLESEFDCPSLKEAKRLKAKETDELEKLEDEYDKDLDRYDSDYPQ